MLSGSARPATTWKGLTPSDVVAQQDDDRRSDRAEGAGSGIATLERRVDRQRARDGRGEGDSAALLSLPHPRTDPAGRDTTRSSWSP